MRIVCPIKEERDLRLGGTIAINLGCVDLSPQDLSPGTRLEELAISITIASVDAGKIVALFVFLMCSRVWNPRGLVNSAFHGSNMQQIQSLGHMHEMNCEYSI